MGELENLQKQKGQYETSIRESNSKLEAVARSLADPKDNQGLDSHQGKQEMAQEAIQKDTAFPSVGEERNVQDLQHDISESKKQLNTKILELQRLTQEIKVGWFEAVRTGKQNSN